MTLVRLGMQFVAAAAAAALIDDFRIFLGVMVLIASNELRRELSS